MRLILPTLAATLAGTLGVSAHAQDAAFPELLVNAGFEDLDGDGSVGDGWGSFGNAGFNAFFGANGHASFFADNAGNSGGVFQTGIAADAGTEYVFRLTDVLVESNFSADLTIALEFFAADDATLLGSESVTVTAASVAAGDAEFADAFTITASAVDGASFVRPLLSFGNSAGASSSANFFVFDASLTVVPEPASAALLASGGLLLLRRRR